MSTEPTAAAPAVTESATEVATPSVPQSDRPSRGPRRHDGGRGPRRDNRDAKAAGEGSGLVEKLVFVNRCAKVVKGGRRFSFAALVVVGDKKGNIGVGIGKANEVPDASKKGIANAQKNMVHVKLKGDTIPHDVFGEYDGGKVLLKPASPGTGLIAGGAVRAVLEAAGVKNVLTKSMGSSNHIAVVNATIAALRQLRHAADFTAARKAS